MFLLFTTFWACSLIRVSLIRVCSLPRQCFSTPKRLHVSRRGGLKPLMHSSAWNRNSRKFVHKEGRSLSFAVRDSGPVDARLLRDMPSLRCFPRQLLTRLVLGPLLFLLRRRLWSPESGVEHG